MEAIDEEVSTESPADDDDLELRVRFSEASTRENLARSHQNHLHGTPREGLLNSLQSQHNKSIDDRDESGLSVSDSRENSVRGVFDTSNYDRHSVEVMASNDVLSGDASDSEDVLFEETDFSDEEDRLIGHLNPLRSEQLANDGTENNGLNEGSGLFGMDEAEVDELLGGAMEEDGLFSQFFRDSPLDNGIYDEVDRLLKAREKICLQDLSSFAWADIIQRYRIVREAERELRHFHSVITSDGTGLGTVVTPAEIRTACNRLLELTGIHAEVHARCIGNCMAFRPDDGLLRCQECGRNRYKILPNGERVNVANFWTIPIIPRVRAWYLDKSKAELLSTYPGIAEKSYEDNIFADFWSGRLYNTVLKAEKGLFTSPTDMAFYFSADEYRTIHKRSQFGVWPLMLLCYNLPTEVRFKEWNTLTYGLIPGPKIPKRVGSFLFPLVDEFKKLEQGVLARNAYRNYEEFTLKGYIVVIEADMIARKHLMRVMGNRAKMYCEYCEICGLWQHAKGVRCCRYKPVNAPPAVVQREERFAREDKPFFDFSEGSDQRRHDAPLRSDEDFRRLAGELANEFNEDIARLCGINGLSIFAELFSVVFPWAFPPDYMHLILLGLLKKIHRILKGVDLDPDEEEKLFFNPDIWKVIGDEQKMSKATYPAAFGDSFNVDTQWSSAMKAANWYTWAVQQALVYLRTALNTAEEYEILKKVMLAVELASRRVITWSEVDELEVLLNDFVEYFEINVYRRDYNRLHMCKPTYHQCGHVCTAIRMCGPMPVYWQFKMEEKCGMLGINTYSPLSFFEDFLSNGFLFFNTGIAHSKRYPNESLFLVIFIQEMLKMVPYIIPPLPRLSGEEATAPLGVAGTGLDTPLGEVLCHPRDGHLMLVRLLHYFKARLELSYRLKGDPLPSELPLDCSRRRRNREKRRFVQEPLANIVNPTCSNHRPVIPADFDFDEWHRQTMDFDHDLFQESGDRRPNAILQKPILPHVEDLGQTRDESKVVRFFEPVKKDTAEGRLTDNEQRALLQYLREKDILPPQLLAATFNELEDMGMNSTKWKAMDITHPESRESYAGMAGFIKRSRVSAYGTVSVPGAPPNTLKVRSDKERSSSHVQYIDSDDLNDLTQEPPRNGYQNYGIVQHFLSVVNPLNLRLVDRHVPDDLSDASDSSDDPDDEQQVVLLAYVHKMEAEETRDGFLVKVSRRLTARMNRLGLSRSSYVSAIQIHCLIGLLYCNDEIYFTWRDGCWTTHGREEVMEDVRERLMLGIAFDGI